MLILNSFAIREGTTKVKLFRNFKERKSFKPEFGAEGTLHQCLKYIVDKNYDTFLQVGICDTYRYGNISIQ